MIWSAFCGTGKSDLCFVDTNMNSLTYLQILEANLLPFASRILPEGFTFQQDDALVHTANVVKGWFKDNNVSVLEWPAKSPDVNPIENLWGILACSVYDSGRRQFNSITELKDATVTSWAAISNETLLNLNKSMPKRCMDILENKGGKIDY